MSVTKDVKPGTALDVAMGQGRNAIYLASQGWTVTGFDIAAEGLAVAQAEAARRGLKIATVKSGYQDATGGTARRAYSGCWRGSGEVAHDRFFLDALGPDLKTIALGESGRPARRS